MNFSKLYILRENLLPSPKEKLFSRNFQNEEVIEVKRSEKERKKKSESVRCANFGINKLNRVSEPSSQN